MYRANLLAILGLGSAQNPHVLRVRCGFCALAAPKLPAPLTPWFIVKKKQGDVTPSPVLGFPLLWH
ncbi:hypothetical protein CPI84_00015 [Erwinia pyrifoliae]|nr:hypothetical protein CPI84_00015 [Erwinia pyrifoliae]